eukprot:Opistho-2@93555
MRRPVAGAAFPCLVVPAALNFVAEEEATYKQVLTIYNPFEFPLKYKVLSTAPDRYVARPFLGVLKPSSSLDIVIRLKEAAASPREDKLKIEIADAKTDAVLGKKVIVCRVIPASLAEVSFADLRESEADAAMISQFRASQKAAESRGGVASASHNYASQAIVALVVLACIGVIVAPTAPPGGPAGITQFAFSAGQQLGAAFILGMVTLAILRAFG